MERKIEVEIGGRKVRIMAHMLNDAMKFGATQEKKIIKETPKELLRPAKVISPLPQMVEVKPEPRPAEKLVEKATKQELLEAVLPEQAFEKPKRKPPVKSKAKK